MITGSSKTIDKSPLLSKKNSISSGSLLSEKFGQCSSVRSASKQYTILLVDDEPTLLEVGSLFLRKYGSFDTICCDSAKGAISTLSDSHVDVIVSDFDMPEINGIEFLTWLRSSGIATPFILCTGRGREEVVIDALNKGATHYLRKGGEPRSLYAELCNIINQILEKTRYEQEVREKEHLITTIFQHLPDPTYAIDLQGTIIAWNRAMEDETGIVQSEAENFWDICCHIPYYYEGCILPSDILEDPCLSVPSEMTLVKRTSENLITEISKAGHSRERTTYRVKTSRLYNGTGNHLGYIESLRDISFEKNAESERVRLSRYHRTLIEAHIDPLVTIDPDLTISDLNQATEVCFSAEREYILGSPFCSWFTNPQMIERICLQLFLDMGSVRDLSLDLITSNGIVPVRLFATTCQDEEFRGEKIFIEIHETSQIPG